MAPEETARLKIAMMSASILHNGLSKSWERRLKLRRRAIGDLPLFPGSFDPRLLVRLALLVLAIHGQSSCDVNLFG